MTNTSKCGLCTANIFTDSELSYQDIQAQAQKEQNGDYPQIIELAMHTDANAYMHDLFDAIAIACEYTLGDDSLKWLITTFKIASLNAGYTGCMVRKAMTYDSYNWLHEIQSQQDPFSDGQIARISATAKIILKKLSDDAFPDELKKAHEIQDCHQTSLAFTSQQNTNNGWYHIASVSDDKGEVRDHSTLIAPRLTKYHATRLTKAINRCLGLTPLDASMTVTSAAWAREAETA